MVLIQIEETKISNEAFFTWTSQSDKVGTPNLVIKMDTNCGSLEQTLSLLQQNITLFTTFSMPALEEIKLSTNKPTSNQKINPLKRFKIVSKSLLKSQKKQPKQKGFIYLFVLSELPVHINVMDAWVHYNNLQQLVLVNPYNTPSAA
jgi:hypothetical protein